MSIGVATTHAALSILNAIPTGIGGAIGIDLKVKAIVKLTSKGNAIIESWAPSGRVRPPRKLVEELVRLARRHGYEGGFYAKVDSSIPIAVGLKSSSAVVNALIHALLRALGKEVSPTNIAKLGVDLAKKSKLTITGAFDDSLASLLEGVFITDNIRVKILKHYRFNDELYAVIIVPNNSNPINNVNPNIFAKYKSHYLSAISFALRGNWLKAMTINGLATMNALGLSMKYSKLIEKILGLSSIKAIGVSGKGPAFFAVTSDPEQVAMRWEGEKLLIAKLLGGSS